jgi:chromobox protein 1
MNTGEIEYEVESVKDHRVTKRRGLEFLVSWVGYNSESDSWEPEINLTGAKQLLEQYWAKESLRQQPSTRRRR